MNGNAVLRAGVVQTCTGVDAAQSAQSIAAAIGRLAAEGADIVFTPEMSNLLDRNSRRLADNVRDEAGDVTLAAAIAAAQAHRVHVALGSLAIRLPQGRIANRSFLIAPDGQLLARYDKMHLFDVDLPNGDSYRESATFAPGDAAAVADLPAARLGFAICYDVRFPALFAALAHAGAAVIAVPAAFTVPTGAAHWHVLMRARAIETGAFIIAAAQSGTHADGRQTYGHSLVIDPWGRILADLGEGPAEAVVSCDLSLVADTRARIPNLRHARPIAPPA